MITVMRKHHKTLMIIITVLVCISFSWYWNKTDFGELGDHHIGAIYGRNVTQIEMQRNARLLRLASQLGMKDLVNGLTSGARTETEAFDNFSWNLMILRHEAEQLGIQPATGEIAATVKAIPAFQGTDGFDIARYTEITDKALAPNGFSEAQIEELAADQITLERIKKILGAGVHIPEKEMRSNYEQAYAKMDVSVVRFKADDFGQDAQVSDDEIAKAYEARKATLKSDEKRKVKFVEFALSDEQKKLTGKERVEALQKVADKATDFTDALEAKGADFDAVAKKFQLTPKETGEFTQATPDPQFSSATQVTQASFNLTKDAPNSVALQTAQGYTVVHLDKVEPPHPLTLAEARADLSEQLKKQKMQGASAAKAAEVAAKLRDEVKNGKALAEVATQAGVKLEKLPPFSLVEQEPEDPAAATASPTPKPKADAEDMPYIKQAASRLEPGKVSDFVRTPDGGMVVVLEKRETLTPDQLAKGLPKVQARALENKNQVAFYEWLRERRHQSGAPEPKPETTPGQAS